MPSTELTKLALEVDLDISASQRVFRKEQRRKRIPRKARLKLLEGVADVWFGSAGNEKSEGKTTLLGQVANDPDDLILIVGVGAFIETIDDDDGWVCIPPGVDAGQRGYALHRFDNERFHLRLQRLVEDERVILDRLVNITFRQRTSLDELGCQSREEEIGIIAVFDSVRKEERPYQEPFPLADFRDSELQCRFAMPGGSLQPEDGR